ncbi:MAG TPA: PilN domain-containing protein [Rhodanobacteraceae bacterium]|nr:PilN domain-containing protein [Rhodanobacteraceae bacterium]
MAKINLLPWRAERRERRKREFFAHLGIAAVAAIVVVLLWGFWVGLRIENQNNRNDYLKGQITQLDSKITEIKNLQKVKDQLLARKRIVEKLQSSRSQMVHLFDQIVQTIPSGARLTSLKQQGDKLTLDGVAQSNATVAEYMRNIEASPWMGPAALQWTRNVHTDANAPYEFELVVTLGTPKSDGTPASGSSAAAALATTDPITSSSSGSPQVSSNTTSAPVTSPTATPAGAAASAPAASASPAAASASKPMDSGKSPRAPAASSSEKGARP